MYHIEIIDKFRRVSASSYGRLCVGIISVWVTCCSYQDESFTSVACNPPVFTSPTSLWLIPEDALTLAGTWRLQVSELAYDCSASQTHFSDVLTEIHSEPLIFDTRDGEVLWLIDESEVQNTQVIGRWVEGEPLTLDLKITRYDQFSGEVNLFHLIVSDVSEEQIEGESWLYSLPQEVLNETSGFTDYSDGILPIYQGKFQLTRLSMIE